MKERILELLRGSEYVSGERMAEVLGVSRTAVWKHIRSLTALGYEIDSQRNRGYRLISKPDLPVPEEVLPDLGTAVIGKELRFHSSVGSTNRVAKRLVREKVKEGMVVIASEQTEGRGRKDRNWSSPEGGLWFSVVLYPDLPPERGMLVTMICSISVVEAVKEVTGLDLVIKWPNDLLIDGKKVCGILTELEAEMDRINSCVVGIGLNVNNDIEEDLKGIAVSLKEARGERISKVKLLRSILKRMDAHYSVLKEGGHDMVREMWKKMSGIEGRRVRVIEEKETFSGEVMDIDGSGCLIIDLDGKRRRVVSGDIEYL
ncbi:MAG: biotin--[acetyl-CoA-carboxylase] ligase [Thermoplasmatota archaeon]